VPGTAPSYRVVIWILLTVVAGVATAAMVRRSPLIKGSGIPQVKAALMRTLRFDWKRELPFKFLGGSLALGTGLSLGREGPSIQLGALVGSGLADVMGRAEIKRYLVTAGAAAGISAAFNAPLAGVLFCLEELHRSFSPVMLTCAMTAAVAANAISWLLLGNANVFSFHLGETLPIALYPAIIVVGLLCGLAGAIFNSAIAGAQSLWKAALPREATRIVAAFAVGGLVAIAVPSVAGGGHHLVDRAAGGELALGALAAIALGELAFTAFSFGSGTPGGIFLPMLAIGALLGGITGRIVEGLGLPGGYNANFVILGMVGFFTAVVRAPITGSILVTEMSGSFAHFPALVLVAVAASLTAGLLRSEPIYDTLLRQLAPQDRPGPVSGAVVLHIPILEGSVIDSCSNAQAAMPPGCVLVGVLRGEEESLPGPDMSIQPGDVIEVLTEESEARETKSRLLELASPGRHSAESGD